MDPASITFSIYLVMVCALPRLIAASANKNDCVCQKISKLPRTKPPPQENYKSGQNFRYTCSDGFVRKAGTSNLIKCQENCVWSTPSLTCIPDPNLPTTQPPNTLSTSASPTSQVKHISSVTTSAFKGMQEPSQGTNVSSDPTPDCVNCTTLVTWTSSTTSESNLSAPSNFSLTLNSDFTNWKASVIPIFIILVLIIIAGGMIYHFKFSGGRGQLHDREREEQVPMRSTQE